MAFSQPCQRSPFFHPFKIHIQFPVKLQSSAKKTQCERGTVLYVQVTKLLGGSLNILLPWPAVIQPCMPSGGIHHPRPAAPWSAGSYPPTARCYSSHAEICVANAALWVLRINKKKKQRFSSWWTTQGWSVCSHVAPRSFTSLESFAKSLSWCNIIPCSSYTTLNVPIYTHTGWG